MSKMDIQNFIKNNNIDNFDNLKSILENTPFNLKIKEDTNFPNIFLIHTSDNSDLNIKLVRECNGLVMEKETFKILCYTFDKCSDSLTLPENLDKEDLFIENALEGTLVRYYCYNNEWILSTKKCIDSSKSRWISKKSFNDLFIDCVKNTYFDVNLLNKNYCYSFLILHNENNIVVKYKSPILYHISTRDMDTLKEVNHSIGINNIQRNYVARENIDNTIMSVNNTRSLDLEGCIFIDGNFNRWKLRTPIFNRARELWGNTNNRIFRYIELRKDPNLLHEYLLYFNEDKYDFMNFENKISLVANDILRFYSEKHIMKKETKIPFYYSKIIYKLHGDFYKDKVKVNYNKIMVELLQVDTKQMCHMINNFEKSLIQPSNTETNTESEVMEVV
jgi:hypothetical protein